MWSPDGRRLAYSAESDLRITPAEGGPAFTVCRIPGSGRLTNGWWHDDGTIYFAVWRENLYRVPASAARHRSSRASLGDGDRCSFVTVLPGDRVIVTTHLRGQMRCASISSTSAVAASGPALRRSGHRRRQVPPPDELLFVRVRRNPGVWVVPFDGGRIDLTRARASRGRRERFDVSSEHARVVRAARERREFVWITHGRDCGFWRSTSTRSIATMPGTVRTRAAIARAVARRQARSVHHPRR